jgi:hypothetical protein
MTLSKISWIFLMKKGYFTPKKSSVYEVYGQKNNAYEVYGV